MAVTKNIELFEGEDKTLVDSAATPPVNITGWTLSFTVKIDREDASPVLISKTVGAGIVITDASNGVFSITLTAADTNITPGKYQYDIWRTNSGAETMLTEGVLTIKASVRV